MEKTRFCNLYRTDQENEGSKILVISLGSAGGVWIHCTLLKYILAERYNKPYYY